MAATITIQIVGAESDSRDVRFSELITQLEAVKIALKETEIGLRDGAKTFAALDYRVIDLTHSSPSQFELEPITERGNRDYANRVLKTFTTELRRIRNHSKLVGRPEINRLIAYDEIGPRKKSRIHEVRITLRERNVNRPIAPREATVDKKFKEKLEIILGPDEITYGAISGRLEYVNVHRKRNFRLYPLIGPRWIRGRFTEDLLPEVRKGLDRHVTVFGKLLFKSWDKHPYAIVAQNIDVHESDSELPTFNDVKGIAPDLTGDVRSSDWVRKIRDEEW
jgi:hypothetical protein